MSHTTLLSQIRSLLVVDIDAMDADVARRHTTEQETFFNMTSNQAIVQFEASSGRREELVRSAVQYVKGQAKDKENVDQDRVVLDTIDVITVLLAKEVYPFIKGHVMAQTSPAYAYDQAATVAHAQRLVKVFEDHGIPQDRVCIKIPATPESLLACKVLESSGIRTLGTCLFSLPQALAGAQAGCTYVAPYFNELRVHFEPEYWKKYDDLSQHPSIISLRSIVQAYSAIEAKTKVMPASLVTPDEVAAIVSQKPQHITISAAILDQLASLPPSSSLSDISTSKPVAPESVPDYLANNGAALREDLASDTETTRKLIDALKIFGEQEQRTKEMVLRLMSAQ